jgi:hypothetical protein
VTSRRKEAWSSPAAERLAPLLRRSADPSLGSSRCRLARSLRTVAREPRRPPVPAGRSVGCAISSGLDSAIGTRSAS